MMNDNEPTMKRTSTILVERGEIEEKAGCPDHGYDLVTGMYLFIFLL